MKTRGGCRIRNADFYSDQTGTFIGPDHGPFETVGSWDEMPPTSSRTFHVRPPGATYGSGDGCSLPAD